MSFTVVIPARFASTRLPGKPLADIAGKPMIQHVFERAMESDAERVVIATDDQRIVQVCEGFGAEALMTSADHASGTDRLEEVARQLGFPGDACLVNVQGDEPLIPAALINQVGHNLLAHPQAAIATLSERITDIGAVTNPNVVKVVTDINGFAHYFSRAPIPWARNDWAGQQPPRDLPASCHYYRHIGIYGYRVSLLRSFVTWPPAPSEVTESLEQLRALHHGARIHVDEACVAPPAGVDTEEDLQRLRALLAASD
ncbi:3-deoxy-manno-octulosonate cytidylyltransferase [Marinobacter sp. X15-166B]|uniref:3-deoxy-manno-octulosonate cytidylyltransferase n=1 Tax=Marinobacter sp. X15-166B TaxID=1897620 RepID=UPI00085C999F|nr:3-deoxy-manno-octulosonate cytidylyltransferase [Marinobacter sp. X15-166B]OEY67226.1 3-deoxy-manno-octulosonate cytidylyltransferase [Marinobacter sp. X15-166B]